MQPLQAVSPAATDAAPSRCPVDHRAMTAGTSSGCPIQHGAGADDAVRRSRADLIARRVLRIRERPAGVTAADANTAFQRSMLISGLRCTLTYVVFPFVMPAVGFATGVGPVLGIVIGVIAMACDIFTVRRFFSVDHRYRWPITLVVACVMGLLTVLLVQDIIHLVT